MKLFILTIAIVMLSFFLARNVAFGQTATPTATPTTAVPTSAPATGFGPY